MYENLVRGFRSIVRFIKKHWRPVIVWGLGAYFCLMGLIFLWAANLRIPDLSELENRKVEQSIGLYDRTGTVLLYDLHNDVRRTVVPLDQISTNVQNATIAIEDPNFYQHKGVEITAIARAILADIIPGGVTQGGSTITQQVVKGALLTRDKTLARKLKEWVLALKMERILTKNQILELYLNQAPYGGNIYGVEEASEAFFGKKAIDLSLPEAAYLAAVLPAPTYYSPYGNHKDLLDRRKNLVLDKMLEHGYITQEQHDSAKVAEVLFQASRATSIQAPHFVFYVRQYLEEKYGADALDQGGWKITTTLDADLQEHAEEIVHENALKNTENFNASNAGMIGLDPKTGQILVMVGSRNYFDPDIDGNYNVTLAERQPGSAFKPFAYAESFIKGYTPDTVLFDTRTQFSTACEPNNFTSEGECYSPVNYDNQFRGPMTLRNALAQSINVPAVKILYLAGLTDTLKLAKAMGISTLGNPGQYGLTLVLGGGEVTLLDMSSAYGAFADNGTHMEPTAILKIEDTSGSVIEDNSEPQGAQVLDPSVAQKINDILSDPVARAPLGENDLLYFPGHDVAVKTGTTDDYRDAWTVGYTPNIVVGVWAGNNDNSPMVKKVSGFIVGPMWHQFMLYAINKLPTESFSRPETADNSGLKPQFRGVWQVPGSDGVIHELLYWVNKDNPLGPAPVNPASDSQFKYWDPPVQVWVQQHGFTPQQQPVGQPQTQTFQQQTGTAIIPH